MPFSWKRALLPAFLCLAAGSFVFFAACSPLTTESPPLADSTFVRVLVDLHLLSARVDHSALPSTGVTDSLLAHHGVQRDDFNATLRHYSQHPGTFESLYNAVIDTLKSLGSRPQPEQHVPGVSDSLNREIRGDT